MCLVLFASQGPTTEIYDATFVFLPFSIVRVRHFESILFKGMVSFLASARLTLFYAVLFSVRRWRHSHTTNLGHDTHPCHKPIPDVRRHRSHTTSGSRHIHTLRAIWPTRAVNGEYIESSVLSQLQSQLTTQCLFLSSRRCSISCRREAP